MNTQQAQEMLSAMMHLADEVSSGNVALIIVGAGGVLVFFVFSKMIYDEVRGIRLALEKQNGNRTIDEYQRRKE